MNSSKYKRKYITRTDAADFNFIEKDLLTFSTCLACILFAPKKSKVLS